MATKQEMLENVENAINARMAGGAVQAYSIGNRNLQYISLSELIKLRNQLKAEICTESGGGRNYAGFGDST